MSFEKAQQLLELATFVAGRRAGVTLDDVGERFGFSRRTAQRIMHALEAQFPDTESGFDEEGHKRWRLQTGALRDLLTLTSDELAALDLSIETLERNAQGIEATELRRLREKILALVPRSKIARLETDHEALLEAQGLAARPGPSARIAPQIALTISTALKSSERLKIVYHSRGSAEPTARVVEPYGVLIGVRRYLVAKPKADTEGPLRYYLTERIQGAELTGESFVRDCQSALEWDPSYCLTCECYPDGAIAADDPMSADPSRQLAFPACSTRGAVGGSGPTQPEPSTDPGHGAAVVVSPSGS